MKTKKQETKKFVYTTRISWVENKNAFIYSSGKPTIGVSAPKEFGGQWGSWSPEELFVASVNSCIQATFLYYAEKNKLKFASYESIAEGTLDREENSYVVSKIKVTPKIVVNFKSQVEAAKIIINLIEKKCPISNSIKTKVEFFPEVSVAE